MKKLILTFAIKLIEKFGKNYITQLNEEFKDGIQAKDFPNALKKIIGKK